jgi:mono/diheme cytochrome c family protein
MNVALALCLVASPPPARGVDWNRVIAALQLVGEEAVEAFELPEPERSRRQQQLSRLLAGAARPVPAGIRAEMESIRKRLLGLDYEVGTACRALIRTILGRVEVRRTPRARPDLARGEKLYLQACAACHGPGATGDSALGATLAPPARDILHPRQNWAPYDMYNRVTYGGAETAMPSFEDGLSGSSAGTSSSTSSPGAGRPARSRFRPSPRTSWRSWGTSSFPTDSDTTRPPACGGPSSPLRRERRPGREQGPDQRGSKVRSRSISRRTSTSSPGEDGLLRTWRIS